MMPRQVFALIALIYLFILPVCADEWGSVTRTEFYSENRKYMLRIKPHPDWPDKPGHCKATLYKGDKKVWSRYLINNHAPVSIFVADSGEYVITMDEWHSVGELPVVIYGDYGELVRVHSTDSLGLKDDILHINTSVSSYWWNEDSVSFFGPEDKYFFIRLHWGKWIVLDLYSGKLYPEEINFYNDELSRKHEKEWPKLLEYRQMMLAKHATRMLDSENAEERKTGALLCGQEKLAKAIPALREMLNDNASYKTNDPKEWTQVYFVRKAAREALEAMGQKVEGVITEEFYNQ